MQNHLVLTGTVSRAPEMRYSPAGIPIARFRLEHRSRRNEAGLPREVRCTLVVVAAGEVLQPVVKGIVPGGIVQVTGFLARGGGRNGDDRMVLHAERIELPGTEADNRIEAN